MGNCGERHTGKHQSSGFFLGWDMATIALVLLNLQFNTHTFALIPD